MPVHSINTFLVFSVIFVWSPKTCENRNMLRNISFIAIALILILCQKGHCHFPQLKNATIYCSNIHSGWQNCSSFYIWIYESKKRKRQIRHTDWVMLYTARHRDLQVSWQPAGKASWQNSGHLLLAKGSALPQHPIFPGLSPSFTSHVSSMSFPWAGTNEIGFKKWFRLMTINSHSVVSWHCLLIS